MKTIALAEAYERLKACEKGAYDAFSSAVKRTLPAPGSLGAFLAFVEGRDAGTKPVKDIMEAAVEARSTAKSEPPTQSFRIARR